MTEANFNKLYDSYGMEIKMKITRDIVHNKTLRELLNVIVREISLELLDMETPRLVENLANHALETALLRSKLEFVESMITFCQEKEKS